MFEIFIICRKRKFSKSLMWQGVQLSDHIGTSTSVGLLWKRKRKEEIIFSKHFPVRSKISYPGVVNLLVYSLPCITSACQLCMYIAAYTWKHCPSLFEIWYDLLPIHLTDMVTILCHCRSQLTSIFCQAFGMMQKMESVNLHFCLFLHLDLSNSWVAPDLLSVSFHTLHMFQAFISFFVAKRLINIVTQK